MRQTLPFLVCNALICSEWAGQPGWGSCFDLCYSPALPGISEMCYLLPSGQGRVNHDDWI